VRRLIVNADDFGLTTGVNRAIVEAHERGIVTSATLMASGGAFEEAVSLAKKCKLSVGCHVVLVDGVPTLSRSAVSSLLADGSSFYPSLGRFVRGLYLRRIRADEIEAEATAQIRKLQASGIAVSHVDTHKHTHIFPQVLGPVLRAAKACGIGAIRNPFERARVSTVWIRSNLLNRWLQVRLLQSYEKAFLRRVREAGFQTTDGAIGVVATGILDEELLHTTIAGLPAGTWELVCHPGHNDDDLGRVHTRLRQSREQELVLLTDPGLRPWLANQKFWLLSYHDFGASGQAPK
jgi:hopanoid biosynthesis associated protein HpnK